MTKSKFYLSTNPHYTDVRHLSYLKLNSHLIGSVIVDSQDNPSIEKYGDIIHHLWVEPRNRKEGFASRLMQRVVNYYGHKPLHLWAEPYGGGEMNIDSLVRFYNGFGFRVVPRPRGRYIGAKLMARKPT